MMWMEEGKSAGLYAQWVAAVGSPMRAGELGKSVVSMKEGHQPTP